MIDYSSAYSRKLKKKRIEFKCKFCKTTKHASFGAIQNLTSHLTGHPEFVSKWLMPFEEEFVKFKKIIDDDTFNLLRAIISANLPLAILENEHFEKCLNLALTSIKTFRNLILPRIYDLMIKAIVKKLENAKTVALITDIWTNKICADFLALAVLILNQNSKQELMVLGMEPMAGHHTAESIKVVIEDIVNRYEFNKRLAKGTNLDFFYKFGLYYYFIFERHNL